MYILRRDFLKYCAGSAAALGLEFSSLGKVLAGRRVLAARKPTYPISTAVNTTLDRRSLPSAHLSCRIPWQIPQLTPSYPCQISLYTQYGYGVWVRNPRRHARRAQISLLRLDMNTQTRYYRPSVPDPSATTLLSFFTMSDMHICDKESPARAFYNGYQYPAPFITNPLTGNLNLQVILRVIQGLYSLRPRSSMPLSRQSTPCTKRRRLISASVSAMRATTLSTTS